mgnify:FL=1
MVFDLGPKPPGEYILAVRGIQGENAGFTVEVGGRSVEMPLPTDDFEWVWSEVALEEEIGELAITNNSGVVAINTLTLIPKEEWEEAQEFADTLVSPTGVLGLRGALDLGSKWREVDYQMISPVEYKVTNDLPGWLVFTDSYHADWRLGGKSPVSLYSMVNGFYSEPGESTLVFEGQKRVDHALTISLVTLALLVGGLFINKWKK